jgi:hypothetical protein
MINYNKLVPGSCFYEIQRIKNPNRKKTEYTDHEGNWWYKYDGPTYTDAVIRILVLGVLQKSIIGEWDANAIDDVKSEIYVENMHSGTRYIMTHDQFDDQYFADEQSAINYLNS